MTADQRFRVHYRIAASDAAEARARARGIAIEQTVEVPEDVIPKGFVRDQITGRVEAVEAHGSGAFDAVISYAPDSAGAEAVQLINVIFGNSSMQQGIRVTGFDPGPVLRTGFAGARFGIEGVRRLTGRDGGGLIAAVIKPQGSTPAELATIAARCAAGGADIVKDDHGLANQPMAPFAERLRAVTDAIGDANARAGTRTRYFVHVTGYTGNPVAEAFAARAAGAGGILVMPGLIGAAAIHALSRDPAFGLPIMAHPAFTGAFVLSPAHGLTHAMMYGTLPRIIGADLSIFPNVGGRFGFSDRECRAIAGACRAEDGIGPPILPAPGGGMSVERAAEMAAMYGPDVVYLMGGSLLRHGPQIGDAIRALRAAVDSAAA